MEQAKNLAKELMTFIDNSPSCYHVTANFADMLEQAGYQALNEQDKWEIQAGGKYFVTRNGSSVIAFRVPKSLKGGFLMAAAHSDSPTFKIKENPEHPAVGHYIQLNTEKYGGSLMATWFDRPLSVAGRVLVQQDGAIYVKPVAVEEDLLVIPSVAIHMDREVNKGTALKANVDLLPLFACGKEPGAFRRLIAGAAGVEEADLLTTDLFLYPRTGGTLTGANEEFVSSARLDDLQCVFGCLRGFLGAADSGSVPVLAVFNNEEVGSGTRQGADSTFLTDVLRRVNGAMGRGEEDWMTAAVNSFLVSADNAHAVHPAHPEYADPNEAPVLNGGIVLKYNASQRYTTDALSAAVFSQICHEAGVPVQRYSNRADLPGGSTLGNISTAHLSVPSVDIGLPQLAMHSAYEVAGAGDTEYLVRAMTAYFGRSFRMGPGGIEI